MASSSTAPLEPTPVPATPEVVVPEGFKLYTENSAKLLLPDTADAFLNPVQEFNRDLSVAVITAFAEARARDRERAFIAKQAKRASRGEPKKKKAKLEGETEKAGAVAAETGETAVEDVTMGAAPNTDASKPDAAKDGVFVKPKIVILEALSATGLRSIRYAQEIPLVKHVIANDLADQAIEAMKRNIELNGLAPEPDASEHAQGKVRVNHGDARALMYSHMDDNRVDVVDLDPYGTAAPFIDAAVQCVNEGGLLCVTCTDASVFATNNYPEKCYANYGGVPVKAEYNHEAGLRLILHSLSVTAARYGRYIEPLLSLSIDFYARVFVRVYTAPVQVKRAITKTSTFYVCTFCQSPHEQPLGRAVEKKNERSGNVNVLFKTQAGPLVDGNKCPECEQTMHVAGPMWNASLHKPEFVDEVLKHVDVNEGKYGTAPRMKGMLTVAKEELNVPFYFTPSTIAGLFHSTCPSLASVASALLHAGHKISRSHACPGSLKTDATRRQIHDVFRSWIKTNPVRMDKVAELSPSRVLLAKEAQQEANFEKHPESPLPGWKVKLVRYQTNPTPNWGPGSKAPEGKKRKRGGEGNEK
ncbi:unnamed protein product [Peniophora sp. CBMAI 1063]|nr:unnamed protein product [Peniophora sp. CBMAI 1063]